MILANRTGMSTHNKRTRKTPVDPKGEIADRMMVAGRSVRTTTIRASLLNLRRISPPLIVYEFIDRHSLSLMGH